MTQGYKMEGDWSLWSTECPRSASLCTKVGLTCCPETSVTKYPSVLYNILNIKDIKQRLINLPA